MDVSGPHITAALVCDRVLEEKDGTLTAVRIIDRVTFLVGPDGELVAPAHPITFLISLKSDAARGSFTLELHREKPSGEAALVLSAPVHLEGEERGVNLVLNAGFEPDQAGLYWYDVYFEGERLTRMPLRAIYQPPPTIGHGG